MKKSPRKLSTISIKRPKELSLRLGIPLDILVTVSENMHVHCWSFEKKVGKKVRTLHDVSPVLKGIQERIDKEILDRFDYPESFKGGIKGGSLRSNALPHSGKRNIGNFDLKDFFPSVKPSRVYKTFVSLGSSPDVARLLTKLVTADNRLPQGFLTSPKVAALILLKMNARLEKLFLSHGVKHTFWIDDLTVSASFPIEKLKLTIKKIAKQEGFIIHKDEDTPTYHNKRQTVTGAVVNTKPSVPKERRIDIKKVVYLCEKVGIRAYWREHIKPDASLTKFVESTRGKISSMIAIDPKYRSLADRWEAMTKLSGL